MPLKCLRRDLDFGNREMVSASNHVIGQPFDDRSLTNEQLSNVSRAWRKNVTAWKSCGSSRFEPIENGHLDRLKILWSFTAAHRILRVRLFELDFFFASLVHLE